MPTKKPSQCDGSDLQPNILCLAANLIGFENRLGKSIY